MSVTTTFLDLQAAPTAPAAPGADHDLLADPLIQAGRRGAPRAAVMPALQAWWTLLARTSVTERAAVCDVVRRRVRAGDATARAWLPVALGETDASLVRAAVRGYLGTTPVSVERRASAVQEAIDWIRRGLALNRAAVFGALLDLGDETTLEALARVRSALPAADAQALCDARADVANEAVADFVADWRARLA